MTYYYFVWVRSSRYHGSEALTYSSDTKHPTGSIVQIELQKELVLGFITGPAPRPRFQTKPIVRGFDLPPLPRHLLKLADWLRVYYPAPIGLISQQFLPSHFSEKQLQAPSPTIFTPPTPENLPPLSAAQRQALGQIAAQDTYLLHGATGSGKTRIYIELSLRTIGVNKSAIILTPEISLTSQLANQLRDAFHERVIVLHSEQTTSERQQAWLSIARAAEPVLVVGPRSALFSPVRHLGLIVLDEAHEAAYKQEQVPQYQTTRVASYLARLTNSTLVLGSATPAVTDYYFAEQKAKKIITLGRLPQSQAFPQTKIAVVDMKQRELFTRSSHLSQPLLDGIREALNRNEQTLLYLNRRGTARLVMCENCGWEALCPHCDVALTYHQDTYDLRCHSCNFSSKVPTNCPACSHPSILFEVAGTKAIAEEVKRLFPEAVIGRYDTDNARKERFEKNYDAVRRGEVNILVGTQLLAKGLDLPKLSTLGVVLADTNLYLPDFSASERTFQLLSQVIGRVGRGHVAGFATIQTYHPNHPIIVTALTQDYPSFYASEITARQRFIFPPFCHLLKLSCRRATAKSAEAAASKLKAAIMASRPEVRIEGPAPALHERFKNKYQWQLVVKATQRAHLTQILAELPTNWSSDIDPADLL